MKRKTLLVDVDNRPKVGRHDPPEVCIEDDCNNKHYGRGMCNTHYTYWWRKSRGQATEEQRKRMAKVRREELVQKKLQLIKEAKDVPCADCGNKFPGVAMDFDHVEGEKRDNISRMAHGTYSIETIMAEMAKCEVVCANCHRIRTYEEVMPYVQ